MLIGKDNWTVYRRHMLATRVHFRIVSICPLIYYK